jgi:hypothetical protein
METTRHIGIDLHRSKFTCCMQMANGRNNFSECRNAGSIRTPRAGVTSVGCTRR